MKIISWNVNGLRSIYKRNFLEWMDSTKAEIICLQEIKAQGDSLPSDLINPGDYYSYFSFSNKKGYSGVAVYVKNKPLSIEYKLGIERFDQDGRIIIVEYHDFFLINLYFPHGGRKKENLDFKLNSYNFFLNYIENFKSKNIIIIGDFNISHREIDLERPKENRNNTMFTDEERKRIDKIIEMDFSDTFRSFNKEKGHYTWWPYYANARERNLGWRIDYAFTSNTLTPKIRDAFILRDIRGSDHCPIGVDIDI